MIGNWVPYIGQWDLPEGPYLCIFNSDGCVPEILWWRVSNEIMGQSRGFYRISFTKGAMEYLRMVVPAYYAVVTNPAGNICSWTPEDEARWLLNRKKSV